MPGLPARGPAVRELGLALPPETMPGWRAWRPLKRWHYVGVYTPQLMLCVGAARIGPAAQHWWAVALPGGELYERTSFMPGGVEMDGSRVRVRTREIEIDLELSERPAVETASPAHPGGYAWTAKQACVPVSGRVVAGGREHVLAGDHGFVDDSAGYHDRHTAWRWSAGIGRLADGRSAAWNLVAGIHDALAASERTLWIEGEPAELGPVEFAADLSGVSFAEGGALGFSEWCTREANANFLLLRSRYRQPFGTFTGQLPGGLELAAGYGVMEDHDVRW